MKVWFHLQYTSCREKIGGSFENQYKSLCANRSKLLDSLEFTFNRAVTEPLFTTNVGRSSSAKLWLDEVLKRLSISSRDIEEFKYYLNIQGWKDPEPISDSFLIQLKLVEKGTALEETIIEIYTYSLPNQMENSVGVVNLYTRNSVVNDYWFFQRIKVSDWEPVFNNSQLILREHYGYSDWIF